MAEGKIYTCDRCKEKVAYGDWFPISYTLHWCRGCVDLYLSDIPEAEAERARRWLEGKGVL